MLWFGFAEDKRDYFSVSFFISVLVTILIKLSNNVWFVSSKSKSFTSSLPSTYSELHYEPEECAAS